MARMYTLDDKLLCGSPEIRIGEKIYAVDDRKSTVQKMIKIFEKHDNKDDVEKIGEVMKLAFGENYKEIEAMDMSFSAYQALSSLVMSAVTGQNPEEAEKSGTFRKE